ncbi:MAG: hypothetical protein MMC23_010087, partial [Stictis urceolatum]|nr:hypothetical protein [Stictis urceolata]
MGRKKHENPSREEKERVRKKRAVIFKRAFQTAIDKDVDIFLVFRYRDDVFYYNSANDALFPPSREELKERGVEQE